MKKLLILEKGNKKIILYRNGLAYLQNNKYDADESFVISEFDGIPFSLRWILHIVYYIILLILIPLKVCSGYEVVDKLVDEL